MASGALSSSSYSSEFQEKLKQYEEEEKRAMNGEEDGSYKVELYIYDMSKGLAKQMSPALLGKQIEGIWHTGVVAYGREYFFGAGGIESCRPGGTILGEPERVEDLGCSQVPYQLFLEYIFGLGESSYRPGAYDLLKHNCNNFSEEVSEFLCGRGIPKNILTLPDEVLNTELGETLSSLAKSLHLKGSEARSVPFGGAENSVNSYVPREVARQREDPELEELNSAIEEVRHNTLILESRRNCLNEKLLKKERKERKKEKKEKKKKKNKSSADIGEEKEGRRRKKRSDSAHGPPEAQAFPEDALHRRRNSEPFDLTNEQPCPDLSSEHPCPDRPHESPVRNRHPLPPSIPKNPSLPPSQPTEPSRSRERTPSPVPHDSDRDPTPPVAPPAPEDRILSAMDTDGPDMPPPEVTPPPTEDIRPLPTQQEPEEELPPEVQREPPIVFKDEIDVSSRGRFGHAWSSTLSLCPSIILSSSSSSSQDDDDDDEDDDDDDDDDASSSSSSYSSFSSSYSSSSISSSSSSCQSSHDSNFSASFNSEACLATTLSDPHFNSESEKRPYNDMDKDLSKINNDKIFSSPNYLRSDVDLETCADATMHWDDNISSNDHSKDTPSDFQLFKTELDIDTNTLRSYNKKRRVSLDKNPDKPESHVSKKLSLTLPESSLPSVASDSGFCRLGTDNFSSTLSLSCNDSSNFNHPNTPVQQSDLKVNNKPPFLAAELAFQPSSKYNLPFYPSSKNSNLSPACNNPSNFSNNSDNDTLCKDEKLHNIKTYSTCSPSSLNLDGSLYPHSTVDSSQPLYEHPSSTSPSNSNVTNVSLLMLPSCPRPSNLPLREKQTPGVRTPPDSLRQVSNFSLNLHSKKDSEENLGRGPLSPTVVSPFDEKFPSGNFDHSYCMNLNSFYNPKPKYLPDKFKYPERSSILENDTHSNSVAESSSPSYKSKLKYKEGLPPRPSKLKINTNTNAEVSSSSLPPLPLPWHSSPSGKSHTSIFNFPTTPSPNSRESSCQKLTDSDSDTFYTPDSTTTYFNFPVSDSTTHSKSLPSSESAVNYRQSPDSESFHTPIGCCPPLNFDTDSKDNTKMSPNSEINQTNADCSSRSSINVGTTDFDNCSHSSFDVASSQTSLQPSSSEIQDDADSTTGCELPESNSSNSFQTNPTLPSVSSSIFEKSSSSDTSETKANLCPRLPPSYEEAISTKKQTSNPSSKCDSSDSYSTEDMSLSRSSTQSSVGSATSFGSSYYTLYIVDPLGRPRTPDDTLWSPESSPPPEDLLRSASTTSVSSFRTISPEPEYFEENTRAFRAMRGLSVGSSNESILTCFSRSQSAGSSSTLQEESRTSSSSSNKLKSDFDPQCKRTELSSSKTASSIACRSQPSSPTRNRSANFNRASSLESMHSVLRKYPEIKSPFGSISTFELGSCSPSPPPNISQATSLDRPPSTDSPILFDSTRGSQQSLLLFRPLPRYLASALSPEPERTVLCYLGPARPFEKPLTFTNIFEETVGDFDAFVHYAAEMLSSEEQKHMEELRAYIIEDEGSWALGEDFNMLFARIFHDPSIPMEAQRHLIRIMAAAALKDDVILMLHQDRKEHTIMNFANKVESLPPEIQEALALFFCNMFEHLSPSEWLLYISEWPEGSQQISNIRVTTKIAVNALLHSNPKVQEYGTALMYNLGTKEAKTVIFDDVAPELAMAILQFFGNNPPEEYAWRVMTALCRFCYASSEVPALIKMIGPDPNTFKGMSERIDLVLEEINGKLSRVRQY